MKSKTLPAGQIKPLPIATNNSVKTTKEGRKERWINEDTGEIREFMVIDRPYSSDYNFHKVWLDDLSKILGILGGAKIAIFNHILENINPYSNEFGGTQTEVSKIINVSKTTVNEVFKTLIENNFMKKVRIGTYLINSRYLVKGGHDKRMGLMLKYDELNENRQLEIFDKDQQGIKFE